MHRPGKVDQGQTGTADERAGHWLTLTSRISVFLLLKDMEVEDLAYVFEKSTCRGTGNRSSSLSMRIGGSFRDLSREVLALLIRLRLSDKTKNPKNPKNSTEKLDRKTR